MGDCLLLLQGFSFLFSFLSSVFFRKPSTGDFGTVAERFRTLGTPVSPPCPSRPTNDGTGRALKVGWDADCGRAFSELSPSFFFFEVFLSTDFRIFCGRRAPKRGENGVVVGFLATFGTPFRPPMPFIPVVSGRGLALNCLCEEVVSECRLVEVSGVNVCWRLALFSDIIFSVAAAFACNCSRSLAFKSSRDRVKANFLWCAASLIRSMKLLDDSSTCFLTSLRSLQGWKK